MKILVLASILGLGVFLGSYRNASSFMAQSQPCFFNRESFPEGSTIIIEGKTYECREGEWVLVD